MDLYYKRKLHVVNIANNMLMLLFDLKALMQKRSKTQPGWYTVQGQSQMDQSFQVNVHIGVYQRT